LKTGLRDAFSALSDPTRREILEQLRVQGTLTAGAIAACFPEISRAAVSKHLRVLRESGLVRADEAGREQHYTLDAAPLVRVHREWLAPFVVDWDANLAALKRRAERRKR
jgi:DNA-binding transcriptional ArsR family regulator